MEKKESLLKKFITLSLIPFVIVGIEAKKSTKSITIGILMGFLSLVFIVFFWGLFFTGDDETSLKNVVNENMKLESKNLELEEKLKDKNSEISELKQKQSKKIETTKEPENKKYTFGSGNYYAGKDFDAGVYDITIVSGNSGNVISSNSFSGGINAIMGTDKDFAEQQYKNIELPEETKLEIKGGIKIKLTIK